MGVVILFILNVIFFILGIVLRLALYSAKLTLSMMTAPAALIQKGMKSLGKSKNVVVKASSLAVYISLKALIALLHF